MIKQKKNIPFDQVSREFDKGIEGADALRADGLSQLNAVRAVKEQRMNRERSRLVAKLGADHERVAQIDQRLKINVAMMRDLKLEAAKARTEIPTVDQNTWVLHGYVRDKKLEPVPNLNVVLFDVAGEQISGVNHGCTGADGYYKLSQKILGGASALVFVRVLAKSGSVLYADSVGLQPAAGTIDYREIILSGEESVCVPPPETPAQPSPFGPTGDTPTPTPTPGTGTGSAQLEKPPRDYWVVKGRVTTRAGTGLSGVFVSIYDKDLFFDDRLGEAETDESGNYSLTYLTADFRDLIERKPDLYMKVIDKNGKTLAKVEKKIWYEAGRVEIVDIQID